MSGTNPTDEYDLARRRHVNAFVAGIAREVDKVTWPIEQAQQLDCIDRDMWSEHRNQ